jgi:hypothetical protein
LKKIVAGVLLAGTSAVAAPASVDTSRCAVLDPTALESAVRRELALEPGRGEGLAIEIACPDGIHAHIRVGSLETELDLGEEPAALRVKFVALAIAELVESVAPPPAPATPIVVATEHEQPLPTPIAAPTHIELAVRAGVRVIAWNQHLMSTLAVDFDIGIGRIGITAALGDDHGGMGKPYLLALSVAHDVVCARGDTTICLVGRGDIGMYGVSFRDDSRMDDMLYAGYWDLAAGVEVRRRIGGVGWIAGIDLGGGDGLIIESKYLEQLDGPFAVATLGASW